MDMKKETWLGPTVVYSALTNVRGIIEKALQMHLYIILNASKCLQYDNATSNVQYEWKNLN